MNKEELFQENVLLRQQVEQLTNQLKQSTKQLAPDNLNWKPLVGKCWNAAAAAWSNELFRQAQLLKIILDDQHLVGKEGPNRAPVEKWTAMHQERFESYITVLQHPEVAHAVCEARERKRNSSLGLPPTASELAELIAKPEEVANVEHSTTPEFNREFSQVQLEPEPEPPTR